MLTYPTNIEKVCLTNSRQLRLPNRSVNTLRTQRPLENRANEVLTCVLGPKASDSFLKLSRFARWRSESRLATSSLSAEDVPKKLVLFENMPC
ncbi:hypothetical protein Y032_0012g1669 [Ancylostoma ceylanicum]|uniref:Uncharacterized protein n=1 Tax=Ancylostoma ceylanicum TaxID=53326 RepID=A0A016VCD5_9BILA|nr:hypothetical protein Y032_0012g1669 [Ancylostoma ceylanicum]